MDQQTLEKYAKLLLNFGIGTGKGLQKGQTVILEVPECAKPLLTELYKETLRLGGHPIVRMIPDGLGKAGFELMSEEQLTHVPLKYLGGLIDEADCLVRIIGEYDKHELDGIPASKIMKRQRAMKPYMDMRRKKEQHGKFDWTLAMYPTQSMADEVGLTFEEYEQEIIQACYLDTEDPVAEWTKLFAELERIKKELNALDIEWINVKSERTDLNVQIGPNRKWLGATGHNIPTYEVYISPDCRGTNGHIQFTEPLYRHGKLVKDAFLAFKDGEVTEVRASVGEDFLKELVASPNANKIGEFSLTDRRVSRITKFMGETLFDENVGGPQGNSHVAIGMAYKESYPGDQSAVTDEEWESMGYNDSSVHTDIVTTEQKTVTATLKDGTKKIIYKDGEFLL